MLLGLGTCGVWPLLTLLASFSRFLEPEPTGRECTESWSSVSEASDGGTAGHIN